MLRSLFSRKGQQTKQRLPTLLK